jgi:hypothetical protein
MCPHIPLAALSNGWVRLNSSRVLAHDARPLVAGVRGSLTGTATWHVEQSWSTISTAARRRRRSPSPSVESAPYVGAGRTVRVGTSGPSVADSRVEPRVVRKWATEQGIAIGDRGRIPLQLVDRYLESDNGGAVTAG